MAPEQARRVVTILSICIAIIGFLVFIFDRVERLHVASWDVGLMVYGGVFSVVLFMNSIGRQATTIRTEYDSQKHNPIRPTPTPGTRPGQAVVVASGPMPSSAIMIERVKPNATERFLKMADAAVAEVLALEGTKPERDASGHATIVTGEGWLTRHDTYAFLIRNEDAPLGCCVIDASRGAKLRLLYIETGMRRRGAASAAIRKLVEFARTMGLGPELEVDILNSNGRAKRFFEHNSFQSVHPGGTVRPDTEDFLAPSEGTGSRLKFVRGLIDTGL